MRWLGAAALVVLAAMPAVAHDPNAVIPRPDQAGLPGLGGPFSLIDAHGDRRTSAEFRGKLLLVTFGFTDCPDVCPLELQTVSQALDLVGPAVAAKVAPLFITVNPTRDTPARMATFLAAFHPGMIGLTGSMAEVGAVVRAYKVHVTYSPDRDPAKVNHSAVQYLMAPDGSLASVLLPGTSAEDIASRLRKYAKN